MRAIPRQIVKTIIILIKIHWFVRRLKGLRLLMFLCSPLIVIVNVKPNMHVRACQSFSFVPLSLSGCKSVIKATVSASVLTLAPPP